MRAINNASRFGQPVSSLSVCGALTPPPALSALIPPQSVQDCGRMRNNGASLNGRSENSLVSPRAAVKQCIDNYWRLIRS